MGGLDFFEALLPQLLVTSAFRRRAVGGRAANLDRLRRNGHQCLSAESRGRTTARSPASSISVACHQCLSAESRGRTGLVVRLAATGESPVPFGGEPWADRQAVPNRRDVLSSPVPFGGEPWADNRENRRRTQSGQVTSAFRRRAVGGHDPAGTFVALDVTSPVPFGGEPWADNFCPCAIGSAPGCHQCLSAESRGRTRFMGAQDNPGDSTSPVPFGGEPWADRIASLA